MTRTDRARELARRFPKVYPDAQCELDYRNPLELLVATILSAQCTDKRVNIVTKELFRRCKRAQDYVDISQEELAAQASLHRNYVGSVERAERDIGITALGALAVALGVSLQEFFAPFRLGQRR